MMEIDDVKKRKGKRGGGSSSETEKGQHVHEMPPGSAVDYYIMLLQQ
jgi:hypothetical protein